MTKTLILGGARSGKSTYALKLGEMHEQHRIFIATAQPLDQEMRERIASHKAVRSNKWETIEAPLDLSDAIASCQNDDAFIVVDCLTLWLSNLMHQDLDVDGEVQRLISSFNSSAASIVFVSNELGLGLVPETPLGRSFRDEQGRLNQLIASECDIVEFIAAGLPLRLKG